MILCHPFQVLLGLVAAAVSPRGFIRTECAFVTIMEALQLVGLLVADDCAGTLNRAVTYLSYVHISLQPWCSQRNSRLCVPTCDPAIDCVFLRVILRCTA